MAVKRPPVRDSRLRARRPRPCKLLRMIRRSALVLCLFLLSSAARAQAPDRPFGTLREQAAMRRLPDLVVQVRKLQEQVEELKKKLEG